MKGQVRSPSSMHGGLRTSKWPYAALAVATVLAMAGCQSSDDGGDSTVANVEALEQALEQHKVYGGQQWRCFPIAGSDFECVGSRHSKTLHISCDPTFRTCRDRQGNVIETHD